MRVRTRNALVLFWGLGTACLPDLDDAGWRIEGTRVLAVAAEPAEADPGQRVEFRALVADTSGEVLAPNLTWSFCSAPKPITENNVVTEACLGDDVVPIAPGAGAVSAPLPGDACQRFGPDPPPGDVRPRDPDVTGGYYQPLLLEGAEDDAVALARIRCNLARSSPELAREYRARYRLNQNPELESLRVTREGVPFEGTTWPAGATLALEARWTTTSTETFVVLDPRTRALETRCEILTVSWFTTRGTFATQRTGRSACEDARGVTNTFTVPETPGPLTVFWVLRDDRGGVDFERATVEVAPDDKVRSR